MKPTLLILAAGMGSRYGGIKQMDSFGPGGEMIIDYSIYDAIRSGFGKIVFVIRQDFAENFKNIFEAKLKGKIETEYVMQEMTSFTEGYKYPKERSKPWGTAHAVLCAKEVIHEPFAVINADDFYGSDAYEKAFAFLSNNVSPKTWCIIGYQLVKTLSENGTVSRGVCDQDNSGNLTGIKERVKIFKDGDRIVYEENDVKTVLSTQALVSMNFWGFHPDVFNFIYSHFQKFLRQNGNQPKAEFFIPIVGDAFIKEENGVIKVIQTSSQWFGVTYKEDASAVKQNIRKLVLDGMYPEKLWS